MRIRSMRRFPACVLACVIAGCAPVHSPAHAPQTRAAAELEAKTVALVMPSDEGVRAFCSGVWVADDLIVTANHCVADEEIGDRIVYAVRGDVSVKDRDEVETLRMAKLEARDEAHDLALLSVKLPPEHDTARLAGDVVAGETSQTMGHPRGLWWSYSAGNVAAVRVMDDEADGVMWWVQSTAAISPGNSGGGLFNDAGELLGIAHAYIPVHAENINLYIHECYVRALLASRKS